MIYSIAIETGTDASDFGVVVPDIKGCYSSGETFEQALVNIKEAICFHLEGLAEAGVLPPEAQAIDVHLADPDFSGWVWAMVEIDLTPYLGKSSKINVTLPDLVTSQIDYVVSRSGKFKSRAHFLQEAAKAKILECT